MSLQHEPLAPATTQAPNNDTNFSSNVNKRRKLENGRAGPGRRKGACQTCRVKKVKCDNAKPICTMCKNTNSECMYLDIPAEPLTLEAATDLVLERLDRLDRQMDLLGSNHSLHNKTYGTTIYQTSGDTVTLQYPKEPIRNGKSSIEPSRDFLQIPPHQTTADSVLAWPIFGESYPTNSLIAPLFQSTNSESDNAPTSLLDDYFTAAEGVPPLNEEQIPFLVDNFLENVHTKNPILDVEALVIHSRRCAKEGIRWDGLSCLVLLACALGFIAKPFHLACDPLSSPADSASTRQTQPSLSASEKELKQGEYCFVLACRRIGLLKPSLAAAQCHFFAGVYLMYTLRPIPSWQHFFQASTMYALYLRLKPDDYNDYIDDFPASFELEHTKRRRLEQCLYWSCFKSECEFRVELDLPQSEIATYDFPHMFPSPPTPLEPHTTGSISPTPSSHSMRSSSAPRPTSHSFPSSAALKPHLEIRLHAKRLCNEEESWYYYLTEIALRRIGNRIINTFFRPPSRHIWLDIKPLLKIAAEFDAQVSSWSANLPPAMQRYETSSAIRAPPGSNEAGSVSRELSWATENRILEMRSWLYQPFLYYLVHAPEKVSGVVVDATLSPDTSRPAGLSADEANVLRQLIASGIQCNLKIIETRSLPHRHHGLWYDLRALMCASLVLLAVVQSGYEYLIPGGTDILWGREETLSLSPVIGRVENAGISAAATSTTSGPVPLPVTVPVSVAEERVVVGGLLGKVLESFDYWEHEAVDMHTHLLVLERIIIKTKAEYREGRGRR